MVAALAVPGIAAEYPRPLAQQWWFTTWGVQSMLWPISQGEGIIVAVIDTGVQADIPDLSGVVLPGLDSAGSDGRVDRDENEVPGHGTGMASHIAAQGSGTGFLGIAPKAKILPINVKHDSRGFPAGIRFAVDAGAKIVNISQVSEGSCPKDVQEAVSYAIQRDVVIAAGAGNTGSEGNESYFPANCAGVLAVGAVDYKFTPWAKSQRQPYVAVAAPGVGVGSVLKDGRFHTSSGGTSGATALTSAAVALVRARYPQMPAREVIQRLIASCRDVGPVGKDEQTGYGLIRPYRALTQAAPKGTPNPVFEAYDKWVQVNGQADQGANPGERAAPKSPSSSSGSGKMIILAGVAGVVLLLVVLAFFVQARRNRTPSRRDPRL